MQKPTIGRVVHFFPATSDALYRNGEPCAATIVHVWTETCVNLALFDRDAHLHARTSVFLPQEGTVPLDAGYAAWPTREVVLEATLDTVSAPLAAVVGNAITFDQLVAYGIATGGNVVNGMPWSFRYRGHPITHESDDCYIIPTENGSMKMGRDDLLITGLKGEIYPCNRAAFEAAHEVAVLDDAAEQRIREVGADVAPRVTKADIEALMARVVYTYEQRPNGSTATFCHAFLDGKFFLATGMSAAVSVDNFNAEVGRDFAFDKAQRATRDKLWELEGYRLHATMAADAEFIGGSMAIID